MNQITVIGRLTKDVEVRYTPSGKAIGNFTVACNSGYGDKKKVQYFNCALWGDRVEKSAQYLLKGTSLTVFGEFDLREYDKKDGSKGFSLDVNVSNFEFQGKASNTGTESVPAPPTKQDKAPIVADDFEDDTIPF
mgnify:CR=1 FL=1